MRRTLIPLAVFAALISPGLSASTEIDVDVLAHSEEFAYDEVVAGELEYDPLASEYARRKAEIESALEEGAGAEWAGQYQFGDGLTFNVTLVIAPDHGFAAIWTGCVGVSGRSFGSVTQQDGRLLLNHEMPNSPGTFGNFSSVLIPVHWGARRYLIGEEQMVEFAELMDSGSGPCVDSCGRFLIRDHDGYLAPKIPDSSFEDRIRALSEAKFARVIRIIGPDMEAIDGAFRWRKARVELDAGSDDGVRAGMEFFSTTAGWITDTITVDRVDENSAVATVIAYDVQPIQLGAGTCLSTYYDDAIEKRVDGRAQFGCEPLEPAER